MFRVKAETESPLKHEVSGDTDRGSVSPNGGRTVPDVEQQTFVTSNGDVEDVPIKRSRDAADDSPATKRFKPSARVREEHIPLDTKLAALASVRKRPLIKPVVEGMITPLSEHLGEAILIEQQENGGGSVVHVYPDVLLDMTAHQKRLFADICYDVIFKENDQEEAEHVFGIIHSGASSIPNILRLIADTYPKTQIVRHVFGQTRLTETVPVSNYVKLVDRTLEYNTHRAGQMQAMSLVGCQKQEETGGYFEQVIAALEENNWLHDVLPWGSLSKYDELDPADSDDGPIMWACPGEQVVPLTELIAVEKGAAVDSAPQKRKRTDVERLQMRPRNEKPREKLVEDRTGAHADMAGLYPDRHAVAAVGFVQGLGGGRYDLKDIIAFHAADMEAVADACGLYFQEEPKDQLLDKEFWVNEAKLNHLRRLGVRYSHIRLKADDIYFIPRKVVHQFKTVSACISVTWHLKHHDYYNTSMKRAPSVLDTKPDEHQHLQAAPVLPLPFSNSTPNSPKVTKASARRHARGVGEKQVRGRGRAPRVKKEVKESSDKVVVNRAKPGRKSNAERLAARSKALAEKESQAGNDAPKPALNPVTSSPSKLPIFLKLTAPSSASSTSPSKSVRHHRRSRSDRYSDDDDDDDESDYDSASSCSTCSGSHSDSGSYTSYTGSSFSSGSGSESFSDSESDNDQHSSSQQLPPKSAQNISNPK